MNVNPSFTGVRQFDGTNYESWKVRMTILLKKEKLLDIVLQPIPAARNRTAEWTDRDDQCLHLITAHLAENMIHIVHGKRHARDLWTALENNYQSKSDVHSAASRDELYSCRYKLENGSNVRDYIINF